MRRTPAIIWPVLAAGLVCLGGCAATPTRPASPFDLAPMEEQAAPLPPGAELRNGSLQNSNPALDGVMRDSGTAGIPSTALPGSGTQTGTPGDGN